MKTVELKVGGRKLRLAFTLGALCEMQDTLSDFDMARLSEYVKTPKTMLDVMAILAKHGEALEGRTLDVDREWLGLHLSPAPNRVAAVQIALLNALAEGMRMETEDDAETEVDEVLESIKKKETAGA